jgi:hypothetical protein
MIAANPNTDVKARAERSFISDKGRRNNDVIAKMFVDLPFH